MGPSRWLWLWLVAALAVACSTPPPPARLFVANEGDGTISVIDTATDRVVATVPVGKRPRALRVSADRRTLYVALGGPPLDGAPSLLPAPGTAGEGIGVVDLRTLRLVRTVMSRDPDAFDVIGDRALAVASGQAGEVAIVEMGSHHVRARIAIAEPRGVVARPDGAAVYVTSASDDRVRVIDPVAGTVIAEIATGAWPGPVVLSRDGQRAIVGNVQGSSVTVIDTVRHTATGLVALPHDSATPSAPRPLGLALSRDGARVYVTTGRGGALSVLELGSGRVIRTIPVGPRASGVAVGLDDLVYTANGSSNEVAVIDADAGRVVHRIRVGASPGALAIER